MRSLWALAAACLSVAPTASGVRADPITGIVAFGDSLTDTGNVYGSAGNTFPASPPYFDGRFSNGPVWVERLAAGLGVPAPTPSQTGGTNYAFGGAETGLTGVSLRGTPNIGPQVAAYLASNPAITAGQLFVVWGGANDFLRFPALPLADPARSVSNLVAEITLLARAGGRTFLVPNLPPLGSPPYVQQQLAPAFPGIVAAMNALTDQFNSRLSAAEDGLEADLGIDIIRLDVNGLFQELLADPGRFGFPNVTDQAKSGPIGVPGVVVPNPDPYLFWDEVHPTGGFHQLLGERATARVNAELGVSRVPEPLSVALFGGLVGVGGLAARRRMKAVA